MTVQELIERLQTADPDAEVLLAQQPNWPLRFTIHGVATGADLAGETECSEHGHYSCDECASAVVYIVEGDQPDHPYAPVEAWAAAR